MAYVLYDGDPEDSASNRIGVFRLNSTDDALVFEHVPSGETVTINSGGLQDAADDPHGNEAHTEQYVVSGTFADDPHDNTQHSEVYAVDGAAQPPETHGNGAHTDTYLTAATAQDSIDFGEPAGVVYASDYSTVNAAVSDNAGGDHVEVVLDAGTHTFDTNIPFEGYDLTIRGQGKNNTTLQASGAARVINEFNADSTSTLRFEDLTIDANNVTGSQRFINIQGRREAIELDGVRIENLNIGTPDTTHGCLHITEFVDDVSIEDTEFRFDTVNGRPQYGVKYRVLHVPDSASIGSLEVRGTDHVGKLMDHTNSERSAEDEDYFNGYKALVDNKAIVSECEFDHWGQYATFLIGNAEGCTIQLSEVTTRDHGSGDQFRTGANSSGVTITYSNVTDAGTGEVNGHKAYGDRSVIVQNYGDNIPDAVTVDGGTFRDSLTPIDIQGGMCSISDVVMRNVGNLSGQSRPIFITSQRSHAGHITLDNVTVRNAQSGDPDVSSDDPRHFDYAVELADHSNNDWYGEVHISNCKFVGFEASVPINDQDAGSTVPTELANNYARDDTGSAPANMLASQ